MAHWFLKKSFNLGMDSNKARRMSCIARLMMTGALPLVIGCWPPLDTVKPADIHETNLKRQEVGVRPIKPEWEFLYRDRLKDRYKECWRYYVKNDPRLLTHKQVERDLRGAIIMEYDTYYSGKRYLNYDREFEQNFAEEISISYNYISSMYTVYYAGDDDSYAELIRTVLHETADKTFDSDFEKTWTPFKEIWSPKGKPPLVITDYTSITDLAKIHVRISRPNLFSVITDRTTATNVAERILRKMGQERL